jgi:DNA-binding CsgD family transcriptional regulator
MVRDPKLALVEAAYGLQHEPEQWLSELGATIRSVLPRSVSSFIHEVVKVEDRWTIGRCWTDDAGLEGVIRGYFEHAPAPLLELFYGVPLSAGIASEQLRGTQLDFGNTILPETFSDAGAVDTFGMSATDPGNRGVALGVCIDGNWRPDAAELTGLVHVATHVAAGIRLRERVVGHGNVLDRADAILDPSGKLEHRAEAIDTQQLGEAVKRIEHARVHGRTADEVLNLWQGLVDGEWSLVDHFDTDGRRYYVAVANPPAAAKSKALSRREREIVGYIASGTSSDATAYALGLNSGTVRAHLHNAMVKLGVRSRVELIGLRATLLDSTVPPAN